jgi:predicted ester cyclase
VEKNNLVAVYREYIACLNRRDWSNLGHFVRDDVQRNGERLGLRGYQAMLEKNYEDIPDLQFRIDLLTSDPPIVGSRLRFECAPKAEFLGLLVNGKKVSFTENVFYQFRDGKIELVWSVIDKAAIEAQL